jgi:hypothetical protein
MKYLNLQNELEYKINDIEFLDAIWMLSKTF